MTFLAAYTLVIDNNDLEICLAMNIISFKIMENAAINSIIKFVHRGVPRILPGGCTFLADLPPPPDLDLDLDPDPHQNNADPQPWALQSKDCCLIYNYV
jgi:hypothetical protein